MANAEIEAPEGLEKEIIQWIAKFNKEMGWKSIEAPPPIPKRLSKAKESRAAPTPPPIPPKAQKAKETDIDYRVLETALHQAEQHIKALRKDNFAKVADPLDDDRESLRKEIEKSYKSHTGKEVHDEFVDSVAELVGRCSEALQSVAEIAETRAQIELEIETLRSFNNDSEAKKNEARLKKFDPATNLAGARADIANHLTNIEREVEASRSAALNSDDMNMAALKYELRKLNDHYEKMFKHERLNKTKRRTQKGSENQESKDIKKDANIPRKALEEIKMKLAVADLLVASKSLVTLRQADGYLKSVKSFVTSVTDKSGDYKAFAKIIEKANKKIQTMKRKYEPYEIMAREELKAQVEKLEGDYPAQSPDMSHAEMKRIETETVELEKIVRGLSKSYEQFATDAKLATKNFVGLSNAIKSFKFEGKRVEGYYGELTQKLKDAQADANKYDRESLDKANRDIKAILIQIAYRTALILKRRDALKNEDSPDLTDDEKEAWKKIKADAIAGQKRQNANKDKKVEFDAKLDGLASTLKDLAGRYKNLGLDTSEIDFSKTTIDLMKKEIADSEEYGDGINRLKKIEDKAELWDEVAKELDDYKNEKVYKAAVTCTNKVEEFAAFADDFMSVIEKAGKISSLSLQKTDIEGFLKTVVSAVNPVELETLRGNAKILNGPMKKNEMEKARIAREAALGAVRAMKAALDTYGPVKHFRLQTFEKSSALELASKQLSKLELKLLTAIK